MTELKPAAFMSYVHADDKYGHLTTLRERLSDEVCVQTGPTVSERSNAPATWNEGQT